MQNKCRLLWCFGLYRQAANAAAPMPICRTAHNMSVFFRRNPGLAYLRGRILLFYNARVAAALPSLYVSGLALFEKGCVTGLTRSSATSVYNWVAIPCDPCTTTLSVPAFHDPVVRLESASKLDTAAVLLPPSAVTLIEKILMCA